VEVANISHKYNVAVYLVLRRGVHHFISKCISFEPEFSKDPKGSGLLGDESKLRKSEEVGELMVPRGVFGPRTHQALGMNNCLSLGIATVPAWTGSQLLLCIPEKCSTTCTAEVQSSQKSPLYGVLFPLKPCFGGCSGGYAKLV